VAITGGYFKRIGQSRVREYSQEGWVRDLPSLQQGRSQHGCSYFVSDDGTKTLLVTGGWSDSGSYLSSTELLHDGSSSWTYSGELPTPRGYLRGGNINNKVLMTGGRQYIGEANINNKVLMTGGRQYIRGANINNKVLMTGGNYKDGQWIYYNEILEFSPPTDPTKPRTGQWKLVANMTRARTKHAVSGIDYSQVAHFCTED